MFGRAEIYIKWALFSLATLVCLLMQSLFLRHWIVLGVQPFLYPLLAAVLGMYEGPLPGSIYGLVLGLLCDVTMLGPIPCFYTLLFPAVGLCAGLLSHSWLPAGFWCAAVTGALGFLMTDLARCLLLALRGKSAWAFGAWVTLRETALSLAFLPLVFLLFRAVYRKCHLYD